jgi:hypothetical protein
LFAEAVVASGRGRGATHDSRFTIHEASGADADAGTVKLSTMQYHLSLGGHLLLWVFPLVLAVFVVVDTLRDWRRGRL